MSNKSSRNNPYIPYNSEQDEIYMYPSDQQSDAQNYAIDGPQIENDSSLDRNYEPINNNAQGKQLRQKPAARHFSTANQDSDQNSLGYLTKQFVQLIIETRPNQCLDISEAARSLNVQKRRIYDITNVLQGIGYIQKVGKNLMRWVGGTKDQLQSQSNQIDNAMFDYENRQRFLDAQIQAMNRKIQQLSTASQSVLHYFTIQQLRYIMVNKLGCTHMIVYNGREGAQISIAQNSQTGKKEIVIESPPKSTKLGTVYIIQKSEANDRNFYAIPVLSEGVQTQNINLHLHQGQINLQPASPHLQGQVMKLQQEKIKLQENGLRECHEKSSTYEDQEKFEQNFNQKDENQPVLKYQQHLNNSDSRQSDEPSNQAQRNSFKRRGRKSYTNKKTVSDPKLTINEQKQQNQKQRVTRSKKQVQSELYFQSDSKQEPSNKNNTSKR